MTQMIPAAVPDPDSFRAGMDYGQLLNRIEDHERRLIDHDTRIATLDTVASTALDVASDAAHDAERATETAATAESEAGAAEVIAIIAAEEATEPPAHDTPVIVEEAVTVVPGAGVDETGDTSTTTEAPKVVREDTSRHRRGGVYGPRR